MTKITLTYPKYSNITPTLLTLLTVLLGFWIAVFSPEFVWAGDIYELSEMAARMYGIVLLNIALVVGLIMHDKRAWLYRLIPLVFHMVGFVVRTIVQLDIEHVPTVIIYLICILLVYALDVFGTDK